MAESNKKVVTKLKNNDLENKKKIKLNQENKDKYNVGYIIYKEKSKKYYKITKITKTNVYAKILTINVKDDITYFEMNTESKEKDLYGKNFIVYNVNETSINNETLTLNERNKAKDYFHTLHNYMRNNGIGYSMSGLKCFNLFYFLMKIEKDGLLDKLEYDKQFTFSEIINKLKDNEREGQEWIYEDLLKYLKNTEKLKKLIYFEIPRDIDAKVLKDFITEKVSFLESNNLQINGKLYEYFIGREQSTIQELGAYFTDRNVSLYISLKSPIKMNEDGTIPYFCDMFGGSGGFTINCVEQLNKLDTEEKINWETEINKIYHLDMNKDVVQYAALEVFLMTKEIPDMKDNFIWSNSFKDNFEHILSKVKDMNLYENNINFEIRTNPPYGGDKLDRQTGEIGKLTKFEKFLKKEIEKCEKGSEKQIKLQTKLSDIKKEIKIFEKDHTEKEKVSICSCSELIRNISSVNKITGDNKENCSLLLLMGMLKHGGRVVAVLKEGVFFDKKFSKLRECLCNNFEIEYITSVPQDAFENTTTKTQIICFSNTGKPTQKIKFYDLIVEKAESDIITFKDEIDYEPILETEKNEVLNFNDNDISKMETFVSEATFEELKEKKFNLQGDTYVKKEKLIPGDDFKLVKLGDICEFNIKYKNELETLKYVQIGDIDYNKIKNYQTYKKENIPNKSNNFIKNKSILICSVRPNLNKIIYINNIENYKDYVFSNSIHSLSKLKINGLYLFEYIKLLFSDKKFISNLCKKASSYPRFGINELIEANIEIPIPKTEELMTKWMNKIDTPSKLKYEEALEELKKESIKS